MTADLRAAAEGKHGESKNVETKAERKSDGGSSVAASAGDAKADSAAVAAATPAGGEDVAAKAMPAGEQQNSGSSGGAGKGKKKGKAGKGAAGAGAAAAKVMGRRACCAPTEAANSCLCFVQLGGRGTSPIAALAQLRQRN